MTTLSTIANVARSGLNLLDKGLTIGSTALKTMAGVTAEGRKLTDVTQESSLFASDKSQERIALVSSILTLTDAIASAGANICTAGSDLTKYIARMIEPKATEEVATVA